MGVKLLDRTGLILEIFADRARTREGVLQVELAALSYQRTRLVRAWTHLERQRGGFGFVGGPGETQIEADRRAIDDQSCGSSASSARWSRPANCTAPARKVPFPVVALVGYTNAGKSTLFNRLTGAEVLAKDMLFATLDPTMRGVRPALRPQGHPVRHRGLHLGPAHPAGRRLPRHARGGAGGRPHPPRPRHRAPRDGRSRPPTWAILAELGVPKTCR
jgi:hypothetical protein